MLFFMFIINIQPIIFKFMTKIFYLLEINSGKIYIIHQYDKCSDHSSCIPVL